MQQLQHRLEELEIVAQTAGDALRNGQARAVPRLRELRELAAEWRIKRLGKRRRQRGPPAGVLAELNNIMQRRFAAGMARHPAKL